MEINFLYWSYLNSPDIGLNRYVHVLFLLLYCFNTVD